MEKLKRLVTENKGETIEDRKGIQVHGREAKGEKDYW
jgi:hypothetical protein